MSTTLEKKNRRILAIDDNVAIHQDFRKILCGHSQSGKELADAEAMLFGEAGSAPVVENFEMDSAYQGEEGLDLVRKSVAEGRPYAMAFIDVRMPPGMDGIETTAKIWQEYPDLQVVICTAYSDYSWEDMVAKLGQSDRLVILKKPFDNIEVIQLAHALTGKWELLQQANRKMHDLEAVVSERTTELTAANQKLVGEIAERKHLEQARQMMEVQLRQSQKLEAIGQLAAGVAHEINTPAQYVGDNTRFLQDSFAQIQKMYGNHKELVAAARNGTLTPGMATKAEEVLAAADMEYLFDQIPAAIKETLEGVNRVTKIVRAMKEFSHPGGAEKSAADINHAIETTVAVARNEWKYVAEVELDLGRDIPAIPCFVGEFNQCILNLVVNSCHAIGDVVQQDPGTKGRITVRTRKDGDHVEISVTDTGAGIPPAARPHIFEPFFTTKGVGKGTGQGLAIVYGTVVKRHGGTVRFETETGKGTSFIMRLPIAPPPGEKEPGFETTMIRRREVVPVGAPAV